MNVCVYVRARARACVRVGATMNIFHVNFCGYAEESTFSSISKKSALFIKDLDICSNLNEHLGQIQSSIR